MAGEIEFNSAADLTPMRKSYGIKLGNPTTGEEAFIVVFDKYPQMGDVHIEGRRVVEASVEHYMELAAAAGWYPVVPGLHDDGTVNEMLAKDGEDI